MSTPAAEPISRVMRAARTLGIDGSCLAAAQLLRTSGAGVIPVVRGDRYAGVVSEAGLAAALAAGAAEDASIEPYVESWPVVPPYADLEAAREALLGPGASPAVVVVDAGELVWGLVLPSDLFPKPPTQPRPSMIGGMATPMGVYLTAGVVTSGPGWFALLLSGAALVTMLAIGRVLAFGLSMLLRERHAPTAADAVDALFPFVVFAALMRVAPIAGYHAAEHQVVHAVERGEPLTLAAVRRMPRVHPRCGTNYAVAMTMGAAIAFGDFGLPPSIQPIQWVLALFLTLTFWRRLGGLAQYWITTKPANDRQLEAGIASGRRLLERFAVVRSARLNPWKSIWNSGIVLVLAGGWTASLLLYGLFAALGRLDVLGLGF